jgi:hypothetical protein
VQDLVLQGRGWDGGVVLDCGDGIARLKNMCDEGVQSVVEETAYSRV